MSTPTWLDQRLTTPCLIYRRIPGGTDEYGNVLYAEEEVATRGYLQPATQQEIQDGRANVGDFTWHGLGEVAPALDGFVRIVVEGISYEATGPPAVFGSFHGSGPHHVEIVVERSTA